jgi:hypothetical protein
MWTLLWCVALLQCIHKGKGVFKWIGIVFSSLMILTTGYSILALSLILIFDFFRNDKKKMIMAYFVVITGYAYMNLPTSITAPESLTVFVTSIKTYYQYILVLIVGYCLPPLFLMRYNEPYIPPEKRKKRGFLKRYFFYIFYPLHICVLMCIKFLMERNV